MKYIPSLWTKFIWALGFQKKENFYTEVDGINYCITKRGNHYSYNNEIIYIGEDNIKLQRIFNRLIRMSGDIVYTSPTGHFYHYTNLGPNLPILIVNDSGVYIHGEYLCRPDGSSEELKQALIEFLENKPEVRKVSMTPTQLKREDYDLSRCYNNGNSPTLKLSDMKPHISLVSQDKNKAVFNHRGNKITLAKQGEELYYGDMYLCDMCEWEVYLSAILTSIFYDEDDQFIDDFEKGADEFFDKVDETERTLSPTSWEALDKALAEPGEPTQELVDLVTGERNYARRDADAMQNAVEEKQAREREELDPAESVKIVNAGQYGRTSPTIGDPTIGDSSRQITSVSHMTLDPESTTFSKTIDAWNNYLISDPVVRDRENVTLVNNGDCLVLDKITHTGSSHKPSQEETTEPGLEIKDVTLRSFSKEVSDKSQFAIDEDLPINYPDGICIGKNIVTPTTYNTFREEPEPVRHTSTESYTRDDDDRDYSSSSSDSSSNND